MFIDSSRVTEPCFFDNVSANLSQYLKELWTYEKPIPMAALAKAWVSGLSLAAIAGSSHAAGMDVFLLCLLCVVVCCVLLFVVCCCLFCVVVCCVLLFVLCCCLFCVVVCCVLLFVLCCCLLCVVVCCQVEISGSG